MNCRGAPMLGLDARALRRLPGPVVLTLVDLDVAWHGQPGPSLHHTNGGLIVRSCLDLLYCRIYCRTSYLSAL